MQTKKSVIQQFIHERNLISESDERTHSSLPDLKLTLTQLLDCITPENKHAQVQAGERVGREIW